MELHKLWSETDRHLESLASLVRECKSVDEASRFSRWLQFSGLLEILERNASVDLLPVDGCGLRRKCKNLIAACGELYRQGKARPGYAQSDIAEINRKLDVIAAHVATVLPKESPNNSRLADGCVLGARMLDSETWVRDGCVPALAGPHPILA